MAKPERANDGSYMVVRKNIDFFVRLRDEYDRFRYKDLDHPDARSILFRALHHDLVEKVDQEVIRRYNTRAIYELADHCEEYIERYETDDTVCPCSCHHDGLKNRADGIHCPNPECDEGPWTKEELVS